ncbi:MAG: DUF6624 domain-containing protein [Myxococcota bacterium]
MTILGVVAAVSALAVGATEREATAAYEAKQWEACAKAWSELAAEVRAGVRKAQLLTSAARCQAQAGKKAAAVASLEQALALDPETEAKLRADPELASVVSHPKFAAAAKKAAGVVASQNRELAAEIMAMVERDQAARNDAMARRAFAGSPEWKAIKALDAEHTRRLGEIIAAHGWPGRKLVGKRASHGAWLLVQHATQDRPFQERCLALMQAAGDDVDPVNVAYLDDRLRALRGDKQLFGTQFEAGDGGWRPRAIEDAEHVDERRRALGLSSLSEEIERLNAETPPPPPPTPAPADGGR